MLEEPVILGGQDGLDEVLRHDRERDGMPQLVGGPPEAGERLRLEFDLLQRLAGDRDHLANPAGVHQEPDGEGRPRRPGILARPEVDLPEGRLATELAGRPRRRLGLAVAQPPERTGQVDGLDRDTGGEDLARGIDEGGVLQPREVHGGRGPPGPDPEGDRRAQGDEEHGRHQEAAPPSGGAEPGRSGGQKDALEGSPAARRGRCRATDVPRFPVGRRPVSRPEPGTPPEAGAASHAARSGQRVAITVSTLRVVSCPGS